MLKFKKWVVSIFIVVSANAMAAQQYQMPVVSSKDEYKACLAKSGELDPQLTALKDRKKELDQQSEQLQRDIKAHVKTRSRVSPFRDEQVDAYNDKLELLNQRVKELNLAGEILDKETGEYNALVEVSNKRCAGMVVSRDDAKEVDKERAENSEH